MIAAWIKQTDTDMTTYVSTLGANWFNAVESNPSPLTCTAVPIQGATGISKSTPIITWTYSNAILSGQLSTNNFMVINSSTGAAVAGTLAIDSTNKIVSFAPSSALVATTLHIAVANVDVRGHFWSEVNCKYSQQLDNWGVITRKVWTNRKIRTRGASSPLKIWRE